MTNEAIILAGGKGSRLANVVDVPKPMAMINDVPFLQILMDDLLVKGITVFHLAVGYRYQVITNYFGNSYMGCKVNYIIENEPLGTGGAIKKALKNVQSETVFIINGDTFFDVDLEYMDEQHEINNSDATMTLKPMEKFDRYGRVELNDKDRVIAFHEKKFCKEGLINGGFYLMNKKVFDGLDLPEQFSLEHDFFEKYITSKNIYGFIEEGYFIDIGIPEDYERAQIELG